LSGAVNSSWDRISSSQLYSLYTGVLDLGAPRNNQAAGYYYNLGSVTYFGVTRPRNVAMVYAIKAVESILVPTSTSTAITQAAAANEPWFNAATNTAATANTQNIYQMGNVGVGTTNPTAKMTIDAGNNPGTGFQLQDGSQGAGKVLTSDANGNGSWQQTTASVLLPVSYPQGNSKPNTAYAGGTTYTLASFTAPSSGIYLITIGSTVLISGGVFNSSSNITNNTSVYGNLFSASANYAEENLCEDATKQNAISGVFKLNAGEVVTFNQNAQNCATWGFSYIRMTAVKL